MSMSAAQILDLIAPQFVSDPNKSIWIQLASDQTNSNFYGSNVNRAIALRAAHTMTLTARLTGDAGAVASKKEGDLAVSFAVSSADASDLGQTGYGRQLQGLRKGSGAFVGVTGGRDVGYYG